MAKTKTPEVGVNKSQAARDMMAKHPDAKASEIVSLLAIKGIEVSDQLVYNLKAKAKSESAVIKSPKAAEKPSAVVKSPKAEEKTSETPSQEKMVAAAMDAGKEGIDEILAWTSANWKVDLARNSVMTLRSKIRAKAGKADMPSAVIKSPKAAEKPSAVIKSPSAGETPSQEKMVAAALDAGHEDLDGIEHWVKSKWKVEIARKVIGTLRWKIKNKASKGEKPSAVVKSPKADRPSAIVKSPKAVASNSVHLDAISTNDLEVVGEVLAKVGAEKLMAIVAFVEKVKG